MSCRGYACYAATHPQGKGRKKEEETPPPRDSSLS